MCKFKSHLSKFKCLIIVTFANMKICLGARKALKILNFDLIGSEKSPMADSVKMQPSKRKRHKRSRIQDRCGRRAHREANVSGGINVTDARYFLLRWSRDAQGVSLWLERRAFLGLAGFSTVL